MRTALITALAATALAAPAEAARTVPRGFYGLSYDGEIRSASDGVQHRTWGRMAANGAESARSVFGWDRAEPSDGGGFEFDETDRLVEDAAQHGIDLLPIVMDTPFWARARVGNWWPKEPERYARYLRALVNRYGPGGTFWDANPNVPRRPLRHWQIYNEPGRSRRYGPVLRAAHRAIKDEDPGAMVVLAGLTGTAHGTPWEVLRSQYRNSGIRGHFDIAALHLYTGEAANIPEGVRRFRRVMTRHGDGRKPLWLTEFGITASKGRTTAPPSQRTLRTTDRGMAAFLWDAYRLLVRNRSRRALSVGRAYWYTWASSYERGAGIFRFTGLYRYANGRFDAKPALARYRASARRDEGCAKTTTARCR